MITTRHKIMSFSLKARGRGRGRPYLSHIVKLKMYKNKRRTKKTSFEARYISIRQVNPQTFVTKLFDTPAYI